jgi:hypothetical protein
VASPFHLFTKMVQASPLPRSRQGATATNDQMQELARLGAQARLQAIDENRSAILRAFPALGSRPTPISNNGSTAPARRTGKSMSPAQRRAVGERMRTYWAKRRGEKAGASGAAATPLPTHPPPVPSARAACPPKHGRPKASGCAPTGRRSGPRRSTAPATRGLDGRLGARSSRRWFVSGGPTPLPISD